METIRRIAVDGSFKGIESEGEVETILNLFRPAYWRRLWIIQEIMLARRITLRCGEKTLPWKSLRTLQSMSQHYSEPAMGSNGEYGETNYKALGLRTNAAMRLIAQKEARGGRLSSNPTPLMNLLEMYRDAECEDPRDKVYGLAALIPCSPGRREFVVDYGRTTHEVFAYTLEYVADEMIQRKGHGYRWLSDWLTELGQILRKSLRLTNEQGMVEAEVRRILTPVL